MAEIRVENLHKSFGDFTAVRDSTFTVPDGDFLTGSAKFSVSAVESAGALPPIDLGTIMLQAAPVQPGQQLKPAATTMKPKDKSAQALFKKWHANARTDGKIPGGLIGYLAREIRATRRY